MKTINKEVILNAERYLSDKKFTREVLEAALKEALKKIDKLWGDVDGNFPTPASENNIYKIVYNHKSKGWATGFMTGMLWLAYEATGDEKYREWALSQIPSFYDRIEKKSGVNHHDMGFLYVPSCVAAYKLTGSELGKKAALMAADHLLTRYIEPGGYIQAWGDVGEHPRLIIDCMNNIPLLYWASEVTGNKNYYDKAVNHAKATIENIIRPDASTFHTFYFNHDGSPDKGTTRQGKSDDSCWARGQAWGIYGLALSYKHTKDAEHLELAERVADYFLRHLPKDSVP